MLAAGVIAEFNPMHNGHRYLLKTIHQQVHPDVLVVVLSTWFSSRGLPSLETVETKTRLALEAGADLVIALPSVYTMQSADYFALYAIEALKTAQVSLLCFGSETADFAMLEQSVAKLDEMKPVPATSQARNASAYNLTPGPNDILAIQYLRYAKEFGMEVRPILRDQSLKSATQTRKDFFAGTSQEEDHLFEAGQRWENYYPYLRYMLLESDPELLRSFFLVEEGIENRLIKMAKQHKDWNSFLAHAITKTYTRARIQRTCMMILMQIPKTEMKNHASFFQIQVLGSNLKGRTWLKSLPAGTPIASKLNQLPEYLQVWETKANSLYGLFSDIKSGWKVVIEYEKTK